MTRSKSSKRWLTEHFDDPYVKQAHRLGLRSRSAFKLLELDDRYNLIKPGACIVDLGSAPGGWSQIAMKRAGRTGRVFSVDILAMEPIVGVDFIEGDFTENEPLEKLNAALAGRSVDLVLSDMAPNMSGMTATDQAKAMYLAELALDFVRSHLKPGGDFLVKLFQGQGFDAYIGDVRSLFEKAIVRKPGASRPRSREVYLLARNRCVR